MGIAELIVLGIIGVMIASAIALIIVIRIIRQGNKKEE